MASNRVSEMRLSMVSLYAGGGVGVAAGIGSQPPQHPAIVPQWVIPLRRFDNLNDLAEIWVTHDAPERLRSDPPLADPFVAVHARSGRRPGIVEMQALKQLESDHPVELLPYRLDPRQIIADRMQMRGVEAKPDARPDIVRQRVTQVPQLLEPGPEGRARSGCSVDPHFHGARYRGQAFGVVARIALEPLVPIIHVVPGMRHDRSQTQRPRPLQFPPQALDAARAQDGIRRRQVDQIAVMRHRCADLVTRHFAAKSPDLVRLEHSLTPLIRRLGEELNRGGPELCPALWRARDPARTRNVRPQHHGDGSSVNPSREISGTNRTPPAWRCSSSPRADRSRMTSSCDARSPTGITSRPPGPSWAMSGSGMRGAAAPTMIPSNGAASRHPAAPSPRRVSIFSRPRRRNRSSASTRRSGRRSTVNTLPPAARYARIAV